MKRISLLSALAAAALVISACGSTAGTPTAENSVTGQTSTSQESPTSEATTTEETTSSEDTEAATGEAGDTGSGPAESTTTIAVDGLDAQSAAWFNTACTGMLPMGDAISAMFGAGMASAMGGGTGAANAPDPKKLQASLVEALTKTGESFTDTAKKLSSQPPPTFDKGSELAKAFVTSLSAAGAQFTELGKKIGAAKVTDMASLEAALSQLDSMGDMDNLEGMDILNKYELDDKTQAAIEKLPACAAIEKSFGSVMPGAPTTTG